MLSGTACLRVSKFSRHEAVVLLEVPFAGVSCSQGISLSRLGCALISGVSRLVWGAYRNMPVSGPAVNGGREVPTC